ncbi:Ureidoglycolate hydrolase [filamentous cyanobacterium CCP1]|nr:Ureidoglycolate hydrolase [filamentous cyanobacterium CCP2]PSB59979.1 Ureidoglycolate hydrolase [filamentous cyanobacterium CCP1]
MSSSLHPLRLQPITPEAFRPYGQVIFATSDGKPYSSEDAQLRLEQGIPRFYIMRLYNRGRQFSHITRHQKCTQCLGPLASQDWFVAVAPPNGAAQPTLESIVAFRVPGTCFIKLNIGTWHAGPYFDAESVDFYNLELSDTNITDHDTCNLRKSYGVELELVD